MSVAGFVPSHTTPDTGLPTWATPDPGALPNARLDPRLPVQVLDSQMGWAHVLCSNGWTAWVDGRYLVPIPAQPQPAAAVAPYRPPSPPTRQPEPARMPPQARSLDLSMERVVAIASELDVPNFLALGGGALIMLASVLTWFNVPGFVSANGFNLPLAFLWASTSTNASNADISKTAFLSIGLALLVTGIAGVATTLVPGANVARRVAGAAPILIAALYFKQMLALTSVFNDAGDTPSLMSLIGIGVYVALIGGVLLIIGKSRIVKA